MRRNPRGTRGVPDCDFCGGSHETFPTADSTSRGGGSLGAYCPHCGDFHDLDIDRPGEYEPHPAVPEGSDPEVVCGECNGTFKIKL